MNSTAPASVTQCLECNAPLSPAETQGLCARCLLKMGLASQFGESSVADAGTRQVVPPPLFPFDFGGYRMLRLLGRGGMGAVYEAEDLASGRRVALKVLGHSLDSPDTRKRFLREGRLAASINHPNSVYVYGTEEIDGTPVITMELVPGGTLHERVKDGGPLPVGEAVDVILQIIAGLEAAHATGILHRDIKPANCFIEPSGTVKVGDFGLSISTLARGDSMLTLAGSVLGTPEFSAPEQLRGEALDVRADIYSVGMTLYYLLTGKTPFQADNIVQLLATVLEKPAPSPRTIRPEIPEALARLVVRCLAKQSGDRFGSYDELRRALLPFTSTAPTPATLALRTVAGVIDKVIFMGLNMTALNLSGWWGDATGTTALNSPNWLWYSIGMLVFQLAYFAVSEGRWGATPGKALMGLRVGGLDRNAPGIPRALLRALIYLVPSMVMFLRFTVSGGAPESLAWNFGLGIALWVYPALLALTARRHNGFATVIDLLTRTRVIQKSAYEPRESVAQSEEPVATTEAMPMIGPFHALSTLAADGEGELVLGYDTKLMRRVWIRKMSADAAPVAAELRHAGRPGRLRWLQGHRNGADSWDAYEAVPGTPLTALLHTPEPWKNVRHWLLDLATEFAAAARDGSMPATLSLDRVWITASGGAKLLDFRAPGSRSDAPSLEVAATPPSLEGGSDASSLSGEPRRGAASTPCGGGVAAIFLNRLAISALEGYVATLEEARTSRPAVPLPLRARDVLRSLRSAIGLDAIAAELRALVQQRPAITRRRRLGLIAGCVIPSLIMAGLSFLGESTFSSWQKKYPGVMRLKSSLKIHERMERGKFPRGVEPAIGIEPMETYIAGRFANIIGDPAAWSSQYVTSMLSKTERQRAAALFARRGQPSAEAMTAARAALGSMLDAEGELPRSRKPKEPDQSLTWLRALSGFIWAAFASVVCAVCFRGGVLMRALGIAVVTRDGADASRGRMLWRACLAWAWLPLAAGSVALLARAISVNTGVVLIAAIVLGGAACSAAMRGRSLQDRLAGTWLVPR